MQVHIKHCQVKIGPMAQAFQVLSALAMTTSRDCGVRDRLLFAVIGIALIGGRIAVFLQVLTLSQL